MQQLYKQACNSRRYLTLKGSIYTAGRGACNVAWQKIREQMLNVPIHNTRQQDAAYGTALLAKGSFN